MKVIDESNFINEVKDGLVLVDFYAEWCGPCKMLSPILEQINNEDENVKIIKVNIDDSRFLANYYQIQSIPTLILLVIDVICVVIFNLNSKVLEDGTLSEPFFLIPLMWLITLVAVIMAIVAFVKNRKDKEKL